MSSTRSLAVASWLLCFVSTVVSVSTISTVGSKFYDSNGNQFYIKGVAYQFSTADPLADTAQCTQDASLMQSLGANTVRVYTVDASADHSGCMEAFDKAGIYVIVDIPKPTASMDRANPSWTMDLYNSYKAVIDAFAEFDNMLGFFVGNEVVNDASTSAAAPYIKAAATNLKQYRDSKGYRKIPIGYAGADIARVKPQLQDYLACGSDSSMAIDFFGQNDYSWCGNSSFTESGYDTLNNNAAGYNIPIFISETGCNIASGGRAFTDQGAIFGSQMNSQWSGAIIYEWVQEVNDYGLVSYSVTATGSQSLGGATPTPMSPDFSNLKSQWSTLNPAGTPSSAYTPSNTPPACPSSTASGWAINGNVVLPTLKLNLQTVSSTSATSSRSSTGTSTSGGRAASSSSTGTGTSIISASSATGAASNQGGSSSGGLSTGAKAGIAIGAVLGALTVALALFLLWRRRKQRRAGVTQTPARFDPDGLEVAGLGTHQPKPELDNTPAMRENGAYQPVPTAELTGHKPNFVNFNESYEHYELPTENAPPPVHEIHTNPTPTTELPTVTPTLIPTAVASTREHTSPAPSPAIPVSTQQHQSSTTEPPITTSAIPQPAASGTSPPSDDEVRRLEEEERRIDAAIAEHERIRALQEERAAVRAKLQQARERARGDP